MAVVERNTMDDDVGTDEGCSNGFEGELGLVAKVSSKSKSTQAEEDFDKWGVQTCGKDCGIIYRQHGKDPTDPGNNWNRGFPSNFISHGGGDDPNEDAEDEDTVNLDSRGCD